MRRSLRYQLVRRADQWAHYHRFEWRRLCDLFERLNGVPKGVLRQERRLFNLESERSHDVGRSYRNHPSQQERV